MDGRVVARGGQDAKGDVRGGEPACLGAVVGKSKLALMSNPYESPQAYPSPPEPPQEPQGTPPSLYRTCTVAIGLFALLLAAVLLVETVAGVAVARMTWLFVVPATAIGSSLVIVGVRSLGGRIDGAWLTAIAALLFLIFFTDDRGLPADQYARKYLDLRPQPDVLFVAARMLPCVLILIFAAVARLSLAIRRGT